MSAVTLISLRERELPWLQSLLFFCPFLCPFILSTSCMRFSSPGILINRCPEAPNPATIHGPREPARRMTARAQRETHSHTLTHSACTAFVRMRRRGVEIRWRGDVAFRRIRPVLRRDPFFIVGRVAERSNTHRPRRRNCSREIKRTVAATRTTTPFSHNYEHNLVGCKSCRRLEGHNSPVICVSIT